MPWEVGNHLENGIYPYHIFLCETEYEGAEGKVYPGNAHGVPLVKRNRFKAHLWYTHKELQKECRQRLLSFLGGNDGVEPRLGYPQMGTF